MRLAALLFLLLSGPAAALPEGWSRLSDLAPGIVQDMRYARDLNFTGGPVPGYEAAECLLLTPVAQALARVETQLAAQGLGLIVWDCYRPTRAVDRFADWAAGDGGPDLSALFHPDLSRSALIPQGYIARKSSHSRGVAVDVGLIPAGKAPPLPQTRPGLRCDGPFANRPAESPLDMGTSFDCFSPLSALDAPVGPDATANRATLTRAMEAEGFAGYRAEWWHFRHEDTPAAAAQDFPVR